MKHLYIYALALIVGLSSAFAEDKELPSSLSVSLSQDPVYGFYPAVYGSIGIGDNTAFTFYGVFWTQTALGWNQDGANLMVETGVGLNFTMADGAININPQIGLSSGNYQSGGGRVVVGDNIVPSLGLYYAEGPFAANLNLIVWKHLRKESKNQNYIDMMMYSANPTYTLSKRLSVGLLCEQLFFRTEASADDPAAGVKEGDSHTTTFYLWVGPSLKYTVKSGASLWFSAGVDLSNSVNNVDDKAIKDYYKLTLSLPF